MKKTVLFILFLISSVCASALTIAAGTYYFDNSLTQYGSVKFVYGTNSGNSTDVTYVVSLRSVGNNRWQLDIPQRAKNIYRYTFAATSIPDGTIRRSFSAVKDSISNVLGEYRTATTEATMTPGWIYVPTSGDNWAQGVWQELTSTPPAEATPSGTLPVLYINTANGAPVTSREEYVAGSYYLDNQGDAAYANIGSASAPLPLEIRGRGNWTWTGFDKKPYKIKLGEGQKLMGMHKSKHFALLADADDPYAGLKNIVGFEVSRRLYMPYTPAQEPIEVVLNGEYLGLYVLTENIRIDNHRVDITEVSAGCTTPDSITGGWLVEIDNYSCDNQVTLTEGNGERIMVTYHDPEVLSGAQQNYLQTQMEAINRALYVQDKNSTAWEALVDKYSAARFYLTQEILEDTESYHGSCYMYKDVGSNTKWHFGPVWDFGNSYWRSAERFIYDGPSFSQIWAGALCSFPSMQNEVYQAWSEFYYLQWPTLDEFVADYWNRIQTAFAHDAAKWPNIQEHTYFRGNVNLGDKFMEKLNWRVNWLYSQWGATQPVGIEDVVGGDTSLEIVSVKIYDSLGRLAGTSLDGFNGRGVYVIVGTTANGETVIKRVIL